MDFFFSQFMISVSLLHLIPMKSGLLELHFSNLMTKERVFAEL